MDIDRPDSGIVVDYFEDNQYQPDLYHINININEKKINQNSISMLDLFNNINPAELILEKDLIIDLVLSFLGFKKNFFHLIKRNNYILYNLSHSSLLEIIKKFEDFNYKIESLNFVLENNLNKEEIKQQTYHTYLISLNNFMFYEVYNVLINISEQIKKKSIDFVSVWSFYDYLNCSKSGFLIQKLNYMFLINDKIFSSDSFLKQDSLDFNYFICVDILDATYQNLNFPNKNRYIWKLFLNCLKPSLKYLQDFFINGYPLDPNKEFYFENTIFKYEDDFWNKCLVLRNEKKIPMCLQKCWKIILTGLKSRLFLRYSNQKVIFDLPAINLYDDFLDNLFLSLGFFKKQIKNDLLQSTEELTSKAFSTNYLNQVDNELKKLFPSNDTLEQINEIEKSESLKSESVKSDFYKSNSSLNILNDNDLKTLEYINKIDQKINNYELLNQNIKNLNENILYENDILNSFRDEHEIDNYFLFNDNELFNKTKQIQLYFENSLVATLNKLIEPITLQTANLFKENFFINLKFFNNYYLMQLEEHSFSLFFDTLFEKLVEDPIGFQENLYSKKYNLKDFGFEDANLILFLEFKKCFEDDIIFFDIISRLNFLFNDLDWISSTIITNEAQDFYNKSFKVLMNLKFIQWLNNNIPCLNRDFNIQKQRSIPNYHLFHKLFLIKHNLCIIVNTLHASVLMKINSLQSNLISLINKTYSYEEIVTVFKNYLNEVGEILHINEENFSINDIKKNPFHILLRKLCQNAIEIWKIWFSLEQIFYSSFNPKNTHKQFKSFCKIKNNFKTKRPKHFDTLMDVMEISQKLDEINKFLMTNAEIFSSII